MDEGFEESEKEGNQEVADVHAVYVGIRGEDHVLVAQAVDGVLDVQAAGLGIGE